MPQLNSYPWFLDFLILCIFVFCLFLKNFFTNNLALKYSPLHAKSNFFSMLH